MRNRRIPIRTCVACRTSGEKKALIRMVRTSDGRVAIDPTGKMPGRGAYLCWSADCLQRGLKDKRLSRALRAEIPAEAVRRIEETIEQGSEDM